MKSNDAGFVHVFLEKFGHRSYDESIADAVEAILSQLVSLCNLLVDWIGTDSFGDGGMECGVEIGNVFRFGEFFGARFDDG